MDETPQPHRVVIVGGGFGGLQVAQKLRRAPVALTLVDRRNFHLFQPLLYQVATGALSPGEIASPLRGVLKRHRNATVVMGDVTGIDLAARTIAVSQAGERRTEVAYDTLVVAAGARHSYFGNDHWAAHAPGLKSLEDALELRRRVLSAFEAAEIEPDPEVQRALLTFVVVGAGPTGVELAGQISEIARDTVKRDFRHIDPTTAAIVLVEGADRVLTAFPPSLSAKAERQLRKLGVTVRNERLVVGVDAEGVTLKAAGGGEEERLDSRTIVWAAGVAASPLAAQLAEATGAPLDRAGRITVEPDLSLPGRPEVFVLGDMVRVSDGEGGQIPLPGVAPAAMQQGRYAAKVIRARLAGDEPPKPFRYVDKGNLATIGRMKAVGEIKGLRLSGTIAWLGWLFIHLFYLTGLQNRFLVFVRWTVSFLTRGRGARLITGGDDDPGRLSGEAPPTG
ncbi:MAG: NAD(P)/FAD-dependent oxidoreductase [Thermoleophilia bacterium]|nr:NAD(P)/FAD-dependent oxidoreductase [Thermoleophilia bacterium]